LYLRNQENLKSLDRRNEDVKESKEPHYDEDKEQQIEEKQEENLGK
jgi:hypothetical protein